MKSITKSLVILLLLSVTLVFIGSSSVTAQDTLASTSSNNTTPTFDPFYAPMFGVHIFQGADPVGAYTVNINPDYASNPMYGTLSGHMIYSHNLGAVSGHIVYLGDERFMPIGSYYTITDADGYYEIDNIPLGDYNVYYYTNLEMVLEGHHHLISPADLTAADPDVVIDYTVEVS
jgi:hypothetical protein